MKRLFLIILTAASLGFASVNKPTLAKEPTQAPDYLMLLANFGIYPVAVDDTPNMCIMIRHKGNDLSFRSLPSLDVPPLGYFYKWTITWIDGTVTIKAANNPGTYANEARSNGVWARIGNAAYVPVNLDKDFIEYARVVSCME